MFEGKIGFWNIYKAILSLNSLPCDRLCNLKFKVCLSVHYKYEKIIALSTYVYEELLNLERQFFNTFGLLRIFVLHKTGYVQLAPYISAQNNAHK